MPELKPAVQSQEKKRQRRNENFGGLSHCFPYSNFFSRFFKKIDYWWKHQTSLFLSLSLLEYAIWTVTSDTCILHCLL